MAIYERTIDKGDIVRAELQDYSGGAKVLISIELSIGQRMLDAAVDKGGSSGAHIVFEGKSYECQLVGARIRSFDEHSKPVGSANVINFDSLTKRR